jgi:hypothetical protein
VLTGQQLVGNLGSGHPWPLGHRGGRFVDLVEQTDDSQAPRWPNSHPTADAVTPHSATRPATAVMAARFMAVTVATRMNARASLDMVASDRSTRGLAVWLAEPRGLAKVLLRPALDSGRHAGCCVCVCVCVSFFAGFRAGVGSRSSGARCQVELDLGREQDAVLSPRTINGVMPISHSRSSGA